MKRYAATNTCFVWSKTIHVIQEQCQQQIQICCWAECNDFTHVLCQQNLWGNQVPNCTYQDFLDHVQTVSKSNVVDFFSFSFFFSLTKLCKRAHLWHTGYTAAKLQVPSLKHGGIWNSQKSMPSICLRLICLRESLRVTTTRYFFFFNLGQSI